VLWGGASAPQAELPLGLCQAEAWHAEQKLRPTKGCTASVSRDCYTH